MCFSCVSRILFFVVYLFSSACLLSWLEQDTSCPTRRMSLSEGQQGDPNGNAPDNNGDARPNVPHPPPLPNPQTTNHFFHFDGESYLILIIFYTNLSCAVNKTVILSKIILQHNNCQLTLHISNVGDPGMQLSKYSDFDLFPMYCTQKC